MLSFLVLHNRELLQSRGETHQVLPLFACCCWQVGPNMLSSIHLVIPAHHHELHPSAALACVWKYETFKLSLYSVLRKCFVETQQQKLGLKNYTLIPHSCPSRQQKGLKHPSKFYRKAPGSTIFLNPKRISYNSKAVKKETKSSYTGLQWADKALGKALLLLSFLWEVHKFLMSQEAHDKNGQTKGPNQSS